MVLAKIIAVVMMVIAIVIRYWIRRREFNRRNFAGIEGFSSFEKMVGTRLLERTMGFIGVAFFVAGGLLLLAVWLLKRSPDILQ